MKQLSFDSFKEIPAPPAPAAPQPAPPPPMKPKPVLEGIGEPVTLNYRGGQLDGIYVDGILLPTYAMFRNSTYCSECKSEKCQHTKEAKRIFKKIPKEWYNNKPGEVEIVRDIQN